MTKSTILPPEHRWQIIAEAVYLALLMGVLILYGVALHLAWIPMHEATRIYMYAAIGGVLGGWAFDAKWFCRGIARLENPNDPNRWRPRRLFWRLYTPFVAGAVAFTAYLAGTSGAAFVKLVDVSAEFAFASCFIVGYFADALVSKTANWLETLVDS